MTEREATYPVFNPEGPGRKTHPGPAIRERPKWITAGPRSVTLPRRSCRHGRPAMNDAMTLSQRADALEQKMSDELDYIVIKSRLYSMADADMGPAPNAAAAMAKNPKARVLMGDDPRLPEMPAKPTLMDFFHYRFDPAAHLLQSARHAVT